MKRKNGKKSMKLNNSGAALVTAIVVIAFVSVLATVIMYTAGTNYYMKTTDLKTKQSFYDAEEALEVIKADLMLISDEAFQAAYEETMIDFVHMSAGTRSAFYYDKYVEKLTEILAARCVDPSGNPISIEDYFKGKINSRFQSGFNISTTALDEHRADGYSALRGVSIEYTKDGYTTIITTDYLIAAPEIDWSAESSLDVVDVNFGFDRKEFEMTDSVMYTNWEKK